MNKPFYTDYFSLYNQSLEHYTNDLEKYTEEVELALDRACERLVNFDCLLPPSMKYKMSKEKWKEWLMNND